MKVVKKKNGYTIICTDGEFEALRVFSELPEGRKQLSGNARNGHTRRIKEGKFLRVDVDNSDREYPSPRNRPAPTPQGTLPS